jgi:peptidyl-prolyl cis-trans isomerase D
MLQQMREQARGIFGWIIIGAIVLVLSIFGFGALNFFVTSEPLVAEVGDTEIRQSQYLSMVESQRRRLLAQLPPGTDPGLLDEDALRDDVLDGLIQRTLLLEAARRSGMGAPEPSLDEVILATPEFQVDGRFDETRFRIVLASAGMTPVSYRQALGEDLLVNQLASAIGDTGFVTESELEAMAALTRQQRDVAWLTFDPSDYTESLVVEEADVRAYYDANADRFLAPEQVTVEYLTLDLAAMAAEEELDEEEILAAYEDEVAAFEGQERRKSAHILLSVDDDRDEAAAVELAAGLRERVLAGEDFADLAEEYSDDTGSAARGGDLGFAVRGTFVPPFERALFDLAVGDLSEPVVSQFGVHLIRLDEVATTEPPSLARLRPTLEQRVRERGAQERFDEARARLETLAYEAADLAEPAEALGLEILTAEPFSRDGGVGDFALTAVVDAAFSDDVLNGGYNSEILEPRDGVALVLRLVEYAPERLRDFEEVQEEARTSVVFERSREQAAADADAVLARLEDGAAVTAVAAESGREWSRLEGMTRDDREAPAPVIREAFAAAQPGEGDRSIARAELAAGGVAVVAVTAVRPGDLAALTEAERTQLSQLVRARLGGAEFDAFRGALRRDIPVIQRNDSELDG